MRQSAFGRLVATCYRRMPARKLGLRIAVHLEGGDIFSLTLRTILRLHHGVDVGDYSYGSLLQPGMADRQTTIGAYVSIGPNVRRIGASHPLSKLSMHPFWYNPTLGFVSADLDVERTGCVIGADSWIGANVVILPTCRRIGIGAVVGAGSVVTKDVDDFVVAVGNPAKPISIRLTPDQRAALLKMRPWESVPQEAAEIIRLLSDET